jgi:hypothetical protein
MKIAYKYLVVDVTGESPKDLEKRLDMHGDEGQRFVGFYPYSHLLNGPSTWAIFEKSYTKYDEEEVDYSKY